LAIQSRDRDLDKMNSSALESRDYGLEITTLAESAVKHQLTNWAWQKVMADKRWLFD